MKKLLSLFFLISSVYANTQNFNTLTHRTESLKSSDPKKALRLYEKAIDSVVNDKDTVFFYLDTVDKITYKNKVIERPDNGEGSRYEFLCNCLGGELKNIFVQGLKGKNRKIISKEKFATLKFVDYENVLEVMKMDSGLVRFTTGKSVPLSKEHIVIIVEPYKNEGKSDHSQDKVYIINPVFNINSIFGKTE